MSAEMSDTEELLSRLDFLTNAYIKKAEELKSFLLSVDKISVEIKIIEEELVRRGVLKYEEKDA